MSSRPLKKKKRVLFSFPHSATPLYIPGDQPGAEFGYVDYSFAEDEQDVAESQV